MDGQNRVKRKKKEARSREPYRRRSEAEVRKIAKEIQEGQISIRGACFRYGMCRQTLKKWLMRISVSSLEEDLSRQIFSQMKEEKQVAALERKVKELTKALQTAELKIEGLETMIRVAEQELRIKIRKKSGAKRSLK
jgi:hypothetical protein